MHLPLLLVVALVSAAPSPKGFVVRAESGSVWLDFSAADGAAPGRAFEIYKEGEELKHPVTGAALGRLEEKIGEGKLVSIADKYSVGALSFGAAAVRTGQRAKLSASVSASVEGRLPKTRGAALDFAVVGMAVGDFEGSGRPQVALASEGAIKLYAYPALNAKPIAELDLPGTSVRALGLEAADMDGDGRAELFVAVYDDAFKRFETRVFMRAGAKWLAAAPLPFLVRTVSDASGRRVLATQQIVDDKSFPFGGVLPLVYRDGKYVQGAEALGSGWIYGAGREEDDARTPVRVNWRERTLEFHPPAAIVRDARYTIRNLAPLGGLAAPFGVFTAGELSKKAAAETVWKAELPGAAQGLALVESAPGVEELAVAVRSASGESSVWTFEL